jgi:hypothetical protein
MYDAIMICSNHRWVCIKSAAERKMCLGTFCLPLLHACVGGALLAATTFSPPHMRTVPNQYARIAPEDIVGIRVGSFTPGRFSALAAETNNFPGSTGHDSLNSRCNGRSRFHHTGLARSYSMQQYLGNAVEALLVTLSAIDLTQPSTRS